MKNHNIKIYAKSINFKHNAIDVLKKLSRTESKFIIDDQQAASLIDKEYQLRLRAGIVIASIILYSFCNIKNVL